MNEDLLIKKDFLHPAFPALSLIFTCTTEGRQNLTVHKSSYTMYCLKLAFKHIGRINCMRDTFRFNGEADEEKRHCYIAGGNGNTFG